jgi:hypothetical protein
MRAGRSAQVGQQGSATAQGARARLRVRCDRAGEIGNLDLDF